MIRILLGSAVSVFGLGAAFAFLGSDLVTGPRGEPLMVSSPSSLALQQAHYYGGPACAQSLALEEDILLTQPGVHVVTLGLRTGPDGTWVAMEYGMAGAQADAALILVFDEAGRILSVSEPFDCLPGGEAEAPSRI